MENASHPDNTFDKSQPDERANLYRDVIAIDGPAGAGKSTVARIVAETIGALLFDTGTLYRAVTLAALQTGIPETDEQALSHLASTLSIDVLPPTKTDGRLYDVLLNGKDVTWEIRTSEVDAHVSAIAAHPAVRQALLPTQRRIARLGRVVMVGRDISTVVVPDAGLKIYLDASLEERARRRYRELTAQDKSVDFDAVLAALRSRDKMDSERDVAPLRVAHDSHKIDTDGLSIESVVSQIVTLAGNISGTA